MNASRLAPLSIARPSADRHMPYPLYITLNRTDQFTVHLIPSLLLIHLCPLFPLIPALPLPSLLLTQYVLHLWFRSRCDKRLSYVQGLQA